MSVVATEVQAEPGRNEIDEGGFVIPPSAHSLRGFRAWATSAEFPRRGRFAFFAARLHVDLIMEELETHNKVKTEVSATVYQLGKSQDGGQFYSDRTLVTNAAAGVSTEPDGTFVTWESLRIGRVKLIPRRDAQNLFVELEGSPDWLLEVVSDSSVVKDTVHLRESYHAAGVGEYWLIDARGADIDFQILVHRAKDYHAARKDRGGWQYSPTFKRWFKLTRKVGRMGLYEYTLHVKA